VHGLPSSQSGIAGSGVHAPDAQRAVPLQTLPSESQVVPSGRRASVGQLATAPLHVSRTSQAPEAARHSVPAGWNVSAGQAPLEPLHACGEPRALPPCVPPAPCHPADPPAPYDLVGVAGVPSCGPIYRGPCAPRSATVHEGPFRWLHALHDRFFDLFYRSR